VVPFDRILDAVQAGTADAGLIIHEAQLTYNKSGFHKALDMGKWWKEKYGLPLPLGGNVLLRSLPDDVKSDCCRMMKESIQYALDNHAEALEYALQFARDMEPRLAEKFVGMYVNHYTLDAGEVIPKAVQLLLDKDTKWACSRIRRKSNLCASIPAANSRNCWSIGRIIVDRCPAVLP
jgi:1,4-dihydroxy-6-naphthoate synthase